MPSDIVVTAPLPATLICEDDWLIGSAYADALRDAGLDVLGPFATAAEALDAFESASAGVAVIDLQLADGQSGPATARELYHRGVGIIICSGHNTCPPELMDIHHVFLHKPVPPEVLYACVISALRQEKKPRNGSRPGDPGRLGENA